MPSIHLILCLLTILQHMLAGGWRSIAAARNNYSTEHVTKHQFIDYQEKMS